MAHNLAHHSNNINHIDNRLRQVDVISTVFCNKISKGILGRQCLRKQSSSYYIDRCGVKERCCSHTCNAHVDRYGQDRDGSGMSNCSRRAAVGLLAGGALLQGINWPAHAANGAYLHISWLIHSFVHSFIQWSIDCRSQIFTTGDSIRIPFQPSTQSHSCIPPSVHQSLYWIMHFLYDKSSWESLWLSLFHPFLDCTWTCESWNSNGLEHHFECPSIHPVIASLCSSVSAWCLGNDYTVHPFLPQVMRSTSNTSKPFLVLMGKCMGQVCTLR